jgi:hypothetical protein
VEAASRHRALVTALTISAAAPALAFQEIPVPPPASGEAAPQPPALALGNPAVPVEPAEPEEMKVFGYTKPKLDFGLELLYGQEQQQQLELQGRPPALEGDSDITVFGKIKRQF